MQRLINIQYKLKAPKNQRNNFGNYNYRSAEDILEAVKPLLQEEHLALIIQDEIINLNNRFYVKAIATLFDNTGKQIAQTSALAREEETKKGQDASQITGAASSYARKYALNGLFAIDDTKDSDFTNTGNNDIKKSIQKSETINPDLDIIEGLKACSAYSELSAYYKANYPNVKDKEAFNKLATQLKNKLKRKEINNEN